MLKSTKDTHELFEEVLRERVVEPVFAQRYTNEPIPKYRMPENELPKETAFQVVSDQLQLDGRPRMNLASFVTTWMEPEAENLMIASFNKNAADIAEYPAIADLQEKCVNMISRLFHAPLTEGMEAMGTSTIGSSEAMMLAGLALKRRWQHSQRSKNLPTNNPNLVCGGNFQVVIEKFANYFEVELRIVPVTRSCPCLDPQKAVEMCDENTIGVVAILGSTFTGHFEDVSLLNTLLEAKNKEKGWNIQIHVDAASGGFIAPFAYPDLVWDFQLPLVASINVSGHKYGLTYPGIGWVIWRNSSALPKDLIFHISYLGEDQPTYTLNFSKGSQQIVGQYYQFIRLGKLGYTHIMNNIICVARHLRESIEAMGMFTIYSPKDIGVPLVAFGLKHPELIQNEAGCFTEYEIADELRKYGWIVPVYPMPADMGDTVIIRVNVREDFSRELSDWFVNDLKKSVKNLQKYFLTPLVDEKASEKLFALDGKITAGRKNLTGIKGHPAC